MPIMSVRLARCTLNGRRYLWAWITYAQAVALCFGDLDNASFLIAHAVRIDLRYDYERYLIIIADD